jgi:hypothetical protein
MLLISVLKMMFFDEPDKSHFHNFIAFFKPTVQMLKSHVRVTSTAETKEFT